MDRLSLHFGAGSLNRFLVVGAVNTVFGLGFFPVVYLLCGNLVSTWLLLVVSYVACPTFSYLTHCLVTFEIRRPTWRSAAWYLAFWLVTFGVNSVLLSFVTGFGRTAVVTVQLVYGITIIFVNFVVIRTIFRRYAV
jgi:putative flippase GtrA